MFCAYTRPKYQVSVNRTIGPLVLFFTRLCTHYTLSVDKSCKPLADIVFAMSKQSKRQ